MLFLDVIWYVYEKVYARLKFAFKTVVIIVVHCCFEMLSSYGILWYSKLFKTRKVSSDTSYFTLVYHQIS